MGKATKQIRKEIRAESKAIARSAYNDKFNIYMKGAYREVIFYRVVCCICIFVAVVAVVYGN